MQHFLLTILFTLVALAYQIGAPSSATARTNPKPLHNTLVITDIDDTLRLLGVRAYGRPHIAMNFIKMNTAFVGMPQLLAALEIQGAKIVYVSGVVKTWHSLSQKFLDSNYFPSGPLFFKESSQISTYDSKVSEIQKILSIDHPTRKVIFIGDNGEKDVSVYETISKDPRFSGRVVATFIHSLYTDSVSRAVPAEQIPWLTAADLTLSLYDLGIAAPSTLFSEIELTIKALSSGEPSDQELAIPDFACVRPSLIEALRGRAVNETNQNLRLYLLELSEQLASHGMRFFDNDWEARKDCAPHEFSFAN